MHGFRENFKFWAGSPAIKSPYVSLRYFPPNLNDLNSTQKVKKTHTQGCGPSLGISIPETIPRQQKKNPARKMRGFP